MLPLAHIDFETRSELDLREVGLWNYSRHPSTQPWCMAWVIGDGEPQLWKFGEQLPAELLVHIMADGLVAAHNAPFELAIWNVIMTGRHGWPFLRPDQVICTMAAGYAMGFPGGLDALAGALRIEHRKDSLGHAIMQRFARPWRNKPVRWMDECPSFVQGGQQFTGAEGLARLGEYCKQDVRAERATYAKLYPLSEAERQVWLMDYRINQRGVAVDVETARAAVSLAEKVKVALDERMAEVTGGVVKTCSSLIALKEWLTAMIGRAVKDLAKQDVADLIAELDGNEYPCDAKAVLALRLRQEAGKTSTAKFKVIADQSDEQGRLHNLYQYHGANTGRWAGRQPQIHNLPRRMPAPAAIEDIINLIRRGDYKQLDSMYGPPLTVMSSVLRALFTAPEGKVLVGGDWTNIEGRGQAWFAGEEWKLAAFRAADANEGPGLYELAYSRMFNVPVESVKNPSEERQIGKVAELAFGYGGGVGSFRVMGKTHGIKVPDEKADEFKRAWRRAHPMITASWREIEGAAICAVRFPGTELRCGHPGRQATYLMVDEHLWCRLPSGRVICYPFAKILPGLYGDTLTYMKVPTPTAPEKIIHDEHNGQGWVRVVTWGGTLFNHIVQGLSACLLRHGLLRMDEMGFPLVIHTHDDINGEIKEGREAWREALQNEMRLAPSWVAGLPLHANCAIMKRYGTK